MSEILDKKKILLLKKIICSHKHLNIQFTFLRMMTDFFLLSKILFQINVSPHIFNISIYTHLNFQISSKYYNCFKFIHTLQWNFIQWVHTVEYGSEYQQLTPKCTSAVLWNKKSMHAFSDPQRIDLWNLLECIEVSSEQYCFFKWFLLYNQQLS